MNTLYLKHPVFHVSLRTLLALIFLFSLAALPQRPVSAAVGDIHFAKENGSALLNCLSWANACTLQRAIDTASVGDFVWAAEGLYKPHATDRAISFQLKSGVTVYGGFEYGETDPRNRDPETFISILSGEIGNLSHTDDNSYHVVTGSGTNSSAVLDGFTVSRGNANGGGLGTSEGGGIFNDHGSPTVSHVIFDGNAAAIGGGMYNYHSSPDLDYVTFNNNSASNDGGGMYDRDATSAPSLNHVTFTNNTAAQEGGGIFNWDSSGMINDSDFTNNHAQSGGGIYLLNSAPAFISVTFSNNTASQFGGGMYLTAGSNLEISNSTFAGNTAGSSGGGVYNLANGPQFMNITFNGNDATGSGGGMYNAGSSTVLTGVNFSNNTASNYGGGLYNVNNSSTITGAAFNNNSASSGGGMYNNDNSSPTIEKTAFIGNTVTFYGGGIYNSNSSPSLNNVTFSGNSAESGGGMYSGGIVEQPSNPVLKNVTFSENSAVSGGGLFAANNSVASITNSILWGNTASSIGPQLYTYAVQDITYSIVQGDYGDDPSNSGKDPLLGPLGTYGGATQVYPLLPGSSAIDSGFNDTCLSQDQRNVTRPQVYNCDRGAFESQGFILNAVSGGGQNTVIFTAFAQPLIVGVASTTAEPVNGGVIRFNVPSGGPSAVPDISLAVATISGGQASMTFVANGGIGNYYITAHTNGSDDIVSFPETNIFPGAVILHLPVVMR